MIKWVASYIGTPWLLGGETIEGGMDCWTLFRHVQREHYGIDVPVFNIEHYSVLSVMNSLRLIKSQEAWQQVACANDGDGVLLGHGHTPHHVGVYIEQEGTKGLLHTQQGIGCIFTTFVNLIHTKWNVLSYYRFVGAKCT